MNDFVFKCFKTKGAKYVYDRSRNCLNVVSDDDYEEFQSISEGKLSAEDSEVLQRYQKFGLFQKNNIKKFKHPETDFLEHSVNHRLSYLILQVTQQCNLRCEYCIYSGIYHDTRQHQNKNMSFETAKKAIDFYLQHSDETEELNFGFYGGEPLLRFDLIKQCIEYIESHVNGHKIRYNMTTNGTLLTEEVGAFLEKYHFSLSISLDGPKEEHNANRKFRSGEGSFDAIMKNVKALKHTHPDLTKDVMFMTVMNPKTEITHVLEYFDTDEILCDHRIKFNQMDEVGLDEELTYHENFLLVRKYEYLKMLASVVNKVPRDCVSRLMKDGEFYIRLLGSRISMCRTIPQTTQRGGPCVAGIRRLFVTTDGEFYPCERVNETSEFCRIGSLENGFEINKISDFINIGCVTEEQCKNCWNLNFCAICFGEIETENKNKITGNDVLKKCDTLRAISLSDLYEYAVLSEFGFSISKREVINNV